ncbi:hypothetical protein, partial [Chitinimonas sp.]|uniref:hypothetical protein n=1 Tax=Chitinimonas sp. TaxID=1934313 RepID=UPI0035ADF614
GSLAAAAIDKLVATGKDGQFTTIDELINQRLLQVYQQADGRPDRHVALQAAIDTMSTLAPRHYGATVAARIRLAQQLDQQGQSAEAGAMLQTVARQVENDPASAGYLADIGKARVWFLLQHQQPTQAEALLASPPYAPLRHDAHDGLALDHAWVLLALGKTEEGLRQMRFAAYSQRNQPNLSQRLYGAKLRKPSLLYPADLAYALNQAGHKTEAHQILATLEGYECISDDEQSYLWGQVRSKALRKLTEGVCPQS